MYSYRTLDNIDIQILYQAFTEAFSDYQINIRLSLGDFQTMLQRRGFNPDNSIGAFKEPGHELVGFILNGLRDWQGRLTSYDLGTGVTPSNRRQGITSRMFQSALEILRYNKVEQYLLEVLQDNKAAFALYKDQGFSITRNYSSFQLNKTDYTPKAPLYDIKYQNQIKANEWEQLKSFWNFTPSWQNSIDSISAVQEEFAYALVHFNNKIAGYGIISKKTGDIPQIAVRNEYRYRGIATDIIAALLQGTEAVTAHVINVDDAYEEMKSFLNKLGFQNIGKQHEMLLTM